MTSDELRDLPPVDRLLGQWDSERPAIPRALLVRAVRDVLDEVRREVLDGSLRRQGFSVRDYVANGRLRARVEEFLRRLRRPRHEKVINATGVLLHTGLGRAPLADAAIDAAARLARYGLVEIDETTGLRGRRESYVRDLLTELTGAEEATVVNNNAAAVMLLLGGLATGREVVVSRGELVEIGGAFRVPDVMQQSGARLVEVGTTNRTRVEDYTAVIGPQTAMLLQVHPSNFKIVGFTEAPALAELVQLGRAHGVRVCSDLGSGYLRRVPGLEFIDEPTVVDAVASGADVVCISGDKMLGGPQCGILLGRREAILELRRHPLFRALRPDKLTLATLEATLLLYREAGDSAPTEIPFYRQILTSLERLRERARAIQHRLGSAEGSVEIAESLAQVGSGSVPGLQFPSVALAVRASGSAADRLAATLRGSQPRVFVRVSEERVWLDLRTVFEDEDEDLATALRTALT